MLKLAFQFIRAPKLAGMTQVKFCEGHGVARSTLEPYIQELKEKDVTTQEAFDQFLQTTKAKRCGRPNKIPTDEIELEAVKILEGMRDAGAVVTGRIAASIVHAVTKKHSRPLLVEFGGGLSYSAVFFSSSSRCFQKNF
jgi:hypothetical protein